jgi:conjugative transfer region protein TrbK
MTIEDWFAPQNVGFIAIGVVIGAVAFIGAEAVCDANVAARSPSPFASRSGAPVEVSPADEELLRCAKLPIEQANDANCRALWVAQRRKFLAPGKERQGDDANTLDLFPTAPKTPSSHPPSNAPISKSE